MPQPTVSDSLDPLSNGDFSTSLGETPLPEALQIARRTPEILHVAPAKGASLPARPGFGRWSPQGRR